MTTNQLEKEAQYVVFVLGGEEYAIQINSVQEIVRVPSITPLPGANKSILGITNLRGSIIPILDLDLKLLNRAPKIEEESRVIVLNLGGRRFGIIVDQVLEVIGVPCESIESANFLGTESESCLFGVAQINGRLLILLDPNESLFS